MSRMDGLRLHRSITLHRVKQAHLEYHRGKVRI